MLSSAVGGGKGEGRFYLGKLGVLPIYIFERGGRKKNLLYGFSRERGGKISLAAKGEALWREKGGKKVVFSFPAKGGVSLLSFSLKERKGG